MSIALTNIAFHVSAAECIVLVNPSPSISTASSLRAPWRRKSMTVRLAFYLIFYGRAFWQCKSLIIYTLVHFALRSGSNPSLPHLHILQVTKQSLAHRVVDEYQIERHFSQNDLRELYNFTPDRLDDPDRKPPPIPLLPKDRLLADMMKVGRFLSRRTVQILMAS